MKEFDFTKCKCKSCSDNSTNELPQAHTHQEEPTPYAVKCEEHGCVYLSHHEYMTQVVKVDSEWVCPICERRARWDDFNFEEALDEKPEEDDE